MFFEQHKLIILLVFGSFILGEVLWSRRTGAAVYNKKDSGANLMILVGSQLSKTFLLGWMLLVLESVRSFQIWQAPNHWFYGLLAIVLVDFFYYWQHRIMHQSKFFWALHEVHHSSPWYNLSTSFRLNWMGPLVTPLFYIPVVMLGFSTQQILGFFTLNLLYQFWLHTQAIPTLGPLEGLINTPSAHRVHHGSNPYCIDKNFGGILMLWDRLFGTYAAEQEAVVYGVTTGFQGHNPFKLIFFPMWRVLRGKQTLERQSAVTETVVAAQIAPGYTRDQSQSVVFAEPSRS